jgi:hypothetical protein
MNMKATKAKKTYVDCHTLSHLFLQPSFSNAIYKCYWRCSKSSRPKKPSCTKIFWMKSSLDRNYVVNYQISVMGAGDGFALCHLDLESTYWIYFFSRDAAWSSAHFLLEKMQGESSMGCVVNRVKLCLYRVAFWAWYHLSWRLFFSIIKFDTSIRGILKRKKLPNFLPRLHLVFVSKKWHLGFEDDTVQFVRCANCVWRDTTPTRSRSQYLSTSNFSLRLLLAQDR